MHDFIKTKTKVKNYSVLYTKSPDYGAARITLIKDEDSKNSLFVVITISHTDGKFTLGEVQLSLD